MNLHDIIVDMNVGRDRIADILKEELEEEEQLPRRQALITLVLGLVFSQIAGFAIVQLSQGVMNFRHPLLIGAILGAVLAALGLYAGYFFYSASGETEELALRRFKGLPVPDSTKPIPQMLRDFHQALSILTCDSQDKEEKRVSAASQMVSHLLNNGMTPTSRLETSLAKAGYSKAVAKGALNFLEEGGFVTVRANGVSLVKTRRRLFL